MATWAEAVADIPINPIFQQPESGTENAGTETSAEKGGTEPGETGAKPAESGTETAKTGTEGEKEQEVTEPAGEGAAKEQSPEERHRQAEARRNRERDSFRQELKADMEKQFSAMQDQFIAGLGLTDPYHGDKPVTTKAEYDTYLAARNSETMNEELEAAGLQRGVIEKLIEQHPDIVAARKAAAEAQQEKTRVLDDGAQRRLEDEIKVIQTYDRDIKTGDDLIAADCYPEVKKLVQAGISISQAWKTVNLEKITAAERERAAQETRNGITGKDHLKGTVQGRGDGMQMPDAVLRMYRTTFPGLSDEELLNKYRGIVKMQKK